MNKSSHVGFSLGGSFVLNSFISHVHSNASNVDVSLHSAGPVYTSAQIAHGLPDINLEIVACKIIFIAIAVLAASFPDRIESRDSGFIGGHRAFSHSLILLFILGFVLFSLDILLGGWLGVTAEHILGAACLGLCSAILWHIVADMLTKQGVKVFWPNPKSFGLLPKAFRPVNTSIFAHVLLWAFIGCVFFLFGQGSIGI